jgi:hypothetical protein
MTRVHVVLPGDVDDPRSPSGGNTYGRRVARELDALGWTVAKHRVAGSWPRPSAAEEAGLVRLLASVPDGETVLLDGLVACGVPEAVVPQAGRVRLVVIVHLPLAAEAGLPADVAAELDARERATLQAVDAVVVTSAAAARQLASPVSVTEPDSAATRQPDGTPPVFVAEPGTDPAPRATGTDGASALVCVAAVTPVKGHDVLVDALASVADRPWTCVCAGPFDRAPGHVAEVRRRIERAGLADRVRLVGPLDPAARDAAYAAADLAVAPSRTETYGMAVAEALARGLPLVATTGGGSPTPSATPRTAPAPACSSRPTTRPRSPPRCGGGSTSRRSAPSSAPPPPPAPPPSPPGPRRPRPSRRPSSRRARPRRAPTPPRQPSAASRTWPTSPPTRSPARRRRASASPSAPASTAHAGHPERAPMPVPTTREPVAARCPAPIEPRGRAPVAGSGSRDVIHRPTTPPPRPPVADVPVPRGRA